MAESNRRYQRIPTPKGVWVAWQNGTQSSVSRVRDLNIGGLFIATPTPAPVGTVVTILLSVPEGEIRSRATVRNVVAAEGMGVEFTNMAESDAARLEKLITRLLPASAEA